MLLGDPAQTFQVNAETIIAQQFDPRRYPHRHLVIVGAGSPSWIDQTLRVMAAVEMLTTAGFELVSVAENEQAHLRYAVLRRSVPAA
ncbi:hypothetical protein [Cryptosporangium japonicum]